MAWFLELRQFSFPVPQCYNLPLLLLKWASGCDCQTEVSLKLLLLLSQQPLPVVTCTYLLSHRVHLGSQAVSGPSSGGLLSLRWPDPDGVGLSVLQYPPSTVWLSTT